MEKRRTLMMITLTIVVTTRTRWTVIVSSWQRKYVTGKEEEDGYPSQEMVIYGSSRSSPRSHSAVGGNFDPQVTNPTPSSPSSISPTVSASSHHITSPHLIDKICHKNLQNGERFSRKVFVGGLPPDIDEGIFSQYFILDLNLWNSVYICVVKYQIPIIQMRSRLPSVVLDPWLWTGHIRLPEIYISLFLFFFFGGGEEVGCGGWILWSMVVIVSAIFFIHFSITGWKQELFPSERLRVSSLPGTIFNLSPFKIASKNIMI